MDYTFSVARRSDTPEILKLYRSLIGTPGCTWHADYPNRDTVESDINAESLYVMTDKRYKIVAVATARPEDDWEESSQWTIQNACYLSRLGVLPEYQGKGIAGMLLQKIISASRRKGYKSIRLLVGINNPAAIRLYERHGFIRRGEMHKHGLEFYKYELNRVNK